jgi:stearoyl-CoA desaturase (delta-9 desaturase)
MQPWLVNSATHLFGYRSHQTRDDSTNLWWVASARHGLRWWEVDPTLLICLLGLVGLAKQIHVPGKILHRESLAAAPQVMEG